MARPGKKLPNIIWFVADDLGDGDLGCYGNPSIRTVNLDRMAAEGIHFTSAFVTTSSCSPSRASFFSGMYPHATGAEDLHVHLPENIRILPFYLAELGYHTMNVGKYHLGPLVVNQFHRTESRVENWKALLEERPESRPFFLSLCFYDPHRDYQPGTIPDPTRCEDVILPPYLPDTPAVRADLAAYYDECVRLDRVVGDVLKYLEQNRIADDTITVFFSDNGMPFPRAKTSCYDSGIRTPFIVRYPPRVPAGTVSSLLFSMVDLTPSMLGLLGIAPKEGMQGSDASRLFLDPSAAGREYIHAESNWHDLDEHIRAVRDSRYKYIRNYFPRQRANVPLDVLRSPSYESLLELRDANRLTAEQMRLFMIPRPAEELYDTWSDPFEFTNLAAEPNFLGELQRLRAECDRWIDSTNDVPPQPRRVDLMDIYTRKIIREDILGKPPPFRQ
jgi:N-sulfoglucosamine sulfohydrolase